MQTDKSGKLLWDDAKFSKFDSHAENLTAVFARKLLVQAGMSQYPNTKPLLVLDNACGTGVVTNTLHQILTDRPSATFEVTCGDLADAMVDSTSKRIKSAAWTNTKVLKVDAQDTKLPSDHFTHVFTNFGPMLFPNASAMLAECNRMLLPKGVCGFTTWKKVGWIDDVKAAFESMPDLPTFPSSEKFASAFSKGHWDQEDYIRDQLVQHGFENIKVEAQSNTSVANDVEQLRISLRAILAIVYRFWTEEQRNEYANQDTENRIERWFGQKYTDGPIPWHWIALVTTSTKPEH